MTWEIESAHSTLRQALDEAQPLYVLPGDPLTRDVLIPALSVSVSVDVMTGYFSSAAFAALAPGLALFLRKSNAGMRMIVSPFLSEDDAKILTGDPALLEQIAQRIFLDDVPAEDEIARHTLECLAWLIAKGRLTIKIALLRDGIFHPKVWLFHDREYRAALHGSTNFTARGLAINREQVTLSREWKGDESRFHVRRLSKEFKRLWLSQDDDCIVMPLPEAVSKKIIATYKGDAMPTEDKVAALWRRAQDSISKVRENDQDEGGRLKIPAGLKWEEGAYKHQKEAVLAWERCGRRGILEMATGAGKTKTALICATRLQDEQKGLFVFIAAPYRPLLEQWGEEVKNFGITPTNLSRCATWAEREQKVKTAARSLRLGSSKTEVFLVSYRLLKKAEFKRLLDQVDNPKLLIADECHHIGGTGSSDEMPASFEFRLGLSATPERQYDDDGTAVLHSYFGGICYRFGLEDAIGRCLTEYEYKIHLVELNRVEEEKWIDITQEIKKHIWKLEEGVSDSKLDCLLRERRLLIEGAQGKLKTLENLIDHVGPREVRHTLIYATDKDPEQLCQVNHMLRNKGIMFHQLTERETSDRKLLKKIIGEFREGRLQALTAKRVLDEGVDIPEVKTGFILASTTVRRQWTQRRGRLLRKCSRTGKVRATIHDFLVIPPGGLESADNWDRDIKQLVAGEIERGMEFARLSCNKADEDGAFEILGRLRRMISRIE